MQTQQTSTSVAQGTDQQPLSDTNQISDLYVTADKVDELYRVEKLLITELHSKQLEDQV